MFSRKKLYKITFKKNEEYTTIIAARSYVKAIEKFHKMHPGGIITISIVCIEEYKNGG